MYDPQKITFFAKTDARGQNVPFGIKAADRTRHMYVIGKTGMGKSTLLENMAVQDIQSGEGLAFIDPHGQTAETLLDYIPEHRKNDVLYFAPFDSDHPVSFNIMEDVGPDKRHLVVSGLMSVFEKIWVDAWSARMAYILQNTLMALLEYPGSTLLGVNRMLSDKDYRNQVVNNINDPGVRSFWVDEFAKYNERYMQEAGDAIKNKIGQFTSNPVIRNIIGQPHSSFSIREIMDDKKILIMNLSKGLIGETNANLLGSMLTTRIYLAAMSRADLPLEKMKEMPNFYFYVDEFQSFANATFADILSEARKYKLNLTIAHQYIEQMEEEVRNAVFGNVGTIIAFRVGPFDAEVLETIFQPKFYAPDIVNLGFAQIYLTLMIDGIGSQPFSAVTLPPIDAPSISCKDMVIAASRLQFTKQRAEVEETIRKFHEPVVPPKRPTPSDRQPDRSQGGRDTRPRTPREGGAERGSDRDRPSARRSSPREQNQSQNQSQGQRRDSGERTERGERGESRPKQKDQNLDELRSVLKNITRTDEGSAKEKRDATPAQKPDAKKPDNPRENQRDSQRDNRRDNPKDNRGDTKQVNTQNSTGAKDDLKNALSGALSSQEKPEQDQSRPQSQQEPKPEPKSEPKPKPKTEPEAASRPAPEPAVERASASEEPKAAPTSDKDELTPKQLERMMRVTTSDKPPLK